MKEKYRQWFPIKKCICDVRFVPHPRINLWHLSSTSALVAKIEVWENIHSIYISHSVYFCVIALWFWNFTRYLHLDVTHWVVAVKAVAGAAAAAEATIFTQTAIKVGLPLAQRRDDSTNVGPTLDQPTFLSGYSGTCSRSSRSRSRSRNSISVIKSSQYTGGDFMFLYRFVRRRRRRRPQILVHAITFEQLFGFLSFLAQLLTLTCRLPD